QGLIKALPESRESGTRLNQIPGMMPSLTSIPPGCAFHPRCMIRGTDCDTKVPALVSKDERERMVACHKVR
ncbi:MAG: methionine ABC transporter ATP-binding protein, partial [Deltaproteobacteria bacterium]